MTQSILVSRYSRFEDQLVVRFQQHPFWSQIRQMSDSSFVAYLLQLGVLSSHFVRWYETAKLGIRFEDAKEVIRHILRDEIPQSAPTHQDDRLWDLEQIGVSRTQVLNVRPSWKTKQTVKKFYRLIKFPHDCYDLHTMVVLRVAGEVFVAETYRHVVAELDLRFGFKPSDQRFYNPHFEHDLKDQGGEGHSDAFENVLGQLITNEAQLQVATEVAERAFKVRYDFHNQFTSQHRTRSFTTRIASIAASLLACWFLSGTTFNMIRYTFEGYERAHWRSYLQNLSPAQRKFYVDCDVWLAEHRLKSGDLAILEKIGTEAAVHETWGDGP